MTLEQWKLTCEKAVRSNFRIRNTRIFACGNRQLRLTQERRSQVRTWVLNLRQARNPNSAKSVEEAVRWKVA